MRIFLVGTDFVRGTGGIQYVNRLLLKMLTEDCLCSVEAFSFTDTSETFCLPFDISEGTRLHAYGRSRAAMVAGLAWRLRAARPDLVLFTHVNMLRLAPLVRMLAPGARVGALAHGVEVWEPVPQKLRRALQNADAVVSPSVYTRDQLIAAAGVAAERVAVLAHGLEPNYGSAERFVAQPAEPATILSVARMDRADTDKGIAVVLQAMPAILRACPQARYVVIGNGNDRARLENQAREIGLAGHVEFRGELASSEVRRCYQQANLFVLPSKQEGFGIVFIEAMYFGLPVVAARSGGSTDVVGDEVTGILVPPDVPDALAAAIIRLLLDPARSRAMGAAGRQRVLDHFLYEHFAARWRAWLTQIFPQAAFQRESLAAGAISRTAVSSAVDR